jgi:purine-cytosine permease-like protein
MYTFRANRFLYIIFIPLILADFAFGYFLDFEYGFFPVLHTIIFLWIILLFIDWAFLNKGFYKKLQDRGAATMFFSNEMEDDLVSKLGKIGYRVDRSKGNKTYYIKKGKNLLLDRLVIFINEGEFIKLKVSNKESELFEDLMVRYKTF